VSVVAWVGTWVVARVGGVGFFLATKELRVGDTNVIFAGLPHSAFLVYTAMANAELTNQVKH